MRQQQFSVKQNRRDAMVASPNIFSIRPAISFRNYVIFFLLFNGKITDVVGQTLNNAENAAVSDVLYNLVA